MFLLYGAMGGFLSRLWVGIVVILIISPAEAKLQARVLTYPIANTILVKFADAFGLRAKHKLSPLVLETVGAKTMDAFCTSSENSPDVLVTHKELNLNDLHPCSLNGVNDFVELKLGYGGIVVLASPDLGLRNISALELYEAVTKIVYKNGRVISNSVYAWNDLTNSGYQLPSVPIKIFVPGINADLRDVFEDRILVNGCQSDPEILKLKSQVPKLYRELCLGVRADSAVLDQELTKNSEIMSKITQEKGIVIFASPNILKEPGIDRYVVAVDGDKPTYESIRDDSYPLSSPIYIYVKQSSLKNVRSLRNFLLYIFSAQNADSGSSEASGFLPLTNQEQHQQFSLIKAGWPNLRLDQADIVDKTWAAVKNVDAYLPESPSEPDMPPTFAGTPLDRKTSHQDGGQMQGFESQSPVIALTIDDRLQESGLPAEGDVFGHGYDEPAQNDVPNVEGVGQSRIFSDVGGVDSDFNQAAEESHDDLSVDDPAVASEAPAWKKLFN